MTINIQLTPTRDKLLVKFPYNEGLIEVAKSIQGRVWSKQLFGWVYPFTKETVTGIISVFQQYGTVMTSPDVFGHVLGQETAAKETLEIINRQDEVQLPEGLKFNVEPFQHQKLAMSLLNKRSSFALFMEMGTGKTKCIVDMLSHWQMLTLVVCPVSVMENWRREIIKNQPQVDCIVLSGSGTNRIVNLHAGIANGVNVFIINYESLWRLLDEFLKYPWEIMVLDESTKIKHRASKQAKAILKLGAVCKRRYIMTGTPMPNSPLELFNQIKFLDPTIFGTNWYVFRDRYAVMGGYQGYQIIGWKNLQELSKKLAGISYRVLKSQCLDLPEKIYKEYRLTMPEDLKSIYKSLAEDLVAEINGQMISANVVLAKLTKLRQIASGFVYDENSRAMSMPSNPKLDQLKEILEQILPGHKVVIWCTFREELQLVKRLCEALKYSSISIIDGSVPQEQRQEAIERFQTDPGTKVFIGQQHAGGLGITLTAGDYCIFFSNDYSPEIRLQCEDRLHRIGQKNSVTYIDLIMKGTVDASIQSMLRRKQDLSHRVSDFNIKEILYGDE